MAQIIKFLRYPGSKRRMLKFLMQHLPGKTKISGRYIEPFLGSGAVFFSLAPNTAVLADINPDLIALFSGIQLFPSDVWQIYSKFGETKQDYHCIRKNNQQQTIQEIAARLLYLNRTCFKGMWRTNKQGEFNVGYGGQDRRWVINEQNLVEVSNALQGVEIKCADFETIINVAEPGDFIFLDPPYKPGQKQEVNEHYSGSSFGFEDQERLAMALMRASQKKVNWAMTNSSHPDILALYSTRYKLEFPKGTGGMPGLLVENSGETFISNYPFGGGKQIS